jgi:hypothetical protein
MAKGKKQMRTNGSTLDLKHNATAPGGENLQQDVRWEFGVPPVNKSTTRPNIQSLF